MITTKGKPVSQDSEKTVKNYIKQVLISRDFFRNNAINAHIVPITFEITRERVDAVYMYHTIYHSIKRPYIPNDGMPFGGDFTDPNILRGALLSKYSNINEEGFKKRTEEFRQSLRYPDFIWDQRCYKAYVDASIDSLESHYRNKRFPHRCLDLMKSNLVMW